MSMLKSYSHIISLSLTLTLSHSRSHTLSISHSFTLDMLNNFCFHVYAQKSLSHTLTLSHSHSFSLSHSFNLSFTHSRHAEQVLFSSLCSKFAVVGENCNGHFLTSSSSPSPVSLDVIELLYLYGIRCITIHGARTLCDLR